MITAKPIDVVFVPWYLKANIDAVGIDLDVLTSKFDAKEKIDSLAKSDIDDFCILNAYFNKYFFTEGFNHSGIPNRIWSTTRLMDNKVRKSKELELINMLSDSSCTFKDTYTMMYNNNTAYVVLKEGSTNFIKFNNKDDLGYFYKSLTNFMFKHFTATDVYASPYFKSFLTLKQNKK